MKKLFGTGMHNEPRSLVSFDVMDSLPSPNSGHSDAILGLLRVKKEDAVVRALLDGDTKEISALAASAPPSGLISGISPRELSVKMPGRFGLSEMKALDAIVAKKDSETFMAAYYGNWHVVPPPDVDGNHTHYADWSSPTNFDMKGKPLTPVIMNDLRRRLPEDRPLPPVMKRTDWDALPDERRAGYAMSENQWLPEGLVVVLPDKPEPLKFEPIKLPESILPRYEDFFQARICGALSVPAYAKVYSPSVYCAPALDRPNPIVHIVVPPCPVKSRLQAKFLYWKKRMDTLSRPHYIERLDREGEKVCYHGATGEDQRFAKWRLAFHEAVALMDKSDALES